LIEPAAVDELMNSPYEFAMASLLGLGTTSSSLLELLSVSTFPFQNVRSHVCWHLPPAL
jgi:hypothetical protein